MTQADEGLQLVKDGDGEEFMAYVTTFSATCRYCSAPFTGRSICDVSILEMAPGAIGADLARAYQDCGVGVRLEWEWMRHERSHWFRRAVALARRMFS